MSLSDPIADMLTRIRNAGKARLPETSMPSSKMKVAIAETLKSAGYLNSLRVEGDTHKALTVELKFKGKHRIPVIEGIERISKPSCRVYVNNTEIPVVLGGLGIAILSTSQGVMTGHAASNKKIGGEVLCHVW
ncbi:MAG: 30S ribosomal protein S8 [Lentisphaerae bacterium]|nr:30S ribosomal protein S8 [Lentisphaerota bacterium]MBT4819154.1 30S ribosomal protein S8 [Lentisphaerota bacterium]MBT5607351.1 30S ribosomal protein S8 [Lentisphaerota bacterium]MBT7058361.1 30S ribosomal protein S8 [Lentisphaerota bacterium]MBT7841678.1 30S ribosomal protein S8 [Lentisphaerota bacterium]